jgi:hypothetical protein
MAHEQLEVGGAADGDHAAEIVEFCPPMRVGRLFNWCFS